MKEYRLTTDLSELLESPPATITFDTETRGNDWTQGDSICITLQISTGPGVGLVIPFCREYFHDIPEAELQRGREHAKALLENPSIKCMAHNGKYDIHVLRNEGIQVANFFLDTMQLAFAVDENMDSKSLSDCVKMFVPEMAGYSDQFDSETNKGRIWEAPRDALIEYGAADVDATFRLARALWQKASVDKRNFETFKKVQMPSLRTFCDLEESGIEINQDALISLGQSMRERVSALEDDILRQVKPAVKRKHLAGGLSISRRDFLADALFSKEGEGLKAREFTAKGAPSTNAKQHLIYFDTNPLVAKILEHSKLNTLCTNFIGTPGENSDADLFGSVHQTKKPSGMWQHIKPDGKIYPTFLLHVTVTGRVTSLKPNGQQFPKHGETGKEFRKIFRPRPGFVFLECDLSQAELRIIATMSGDPRMMEAYQNGEDLHAVTAAGNLGISLDKFKDLPPEEQKKHRQAAKGSNFGLCYYQQWKGYQHYVRSAFGVHLTDSEAKKLRERYFKTYPKIAEWHEKQIRFAKQHGFVRALHGSVRRLPGIHSEDGAVEALAKRQAINAPVSRFSSDLALIGLNEFARHCKSRGVWMRDVFPCLFIHDANVLEVRREALEEIAGSLKWHMENPPLKRMFNLTLPVPLKSDAEFGEQNLSEMTALDIEAITPKINSCKTR